MRKQIKLTFILALAFHATFAQQARPNFIFIYTDDQRHDCLGVVQKELGDMARFPWLQTPNLDKLAAEGIRFKNAFVVQSLCTPSRASFLTGQYPRTRNTYTNFTGCPRNKNHWGHELTRAGYRTAYIGKWHMGDEGGQRPGFTYSASYRGQGRFFDCPFEINGQETQTRGWVDNVSTDFAIDFIRNNHHQPFAVAIGYKSAHVPFTPFGEYENRYHNAQMGPAQNHMDFPIYLGRVHYAKPEHLKPHGNVLTKDYIDYFRTLTAIDDNVGKIMHLLDELGIDDNTMIIYSSDNGYHFGEHGIGDKRSAYEVSMRVPMIARFPQAQMPVQVSEAMVLNIDLAPTLLDMAGLEIPENMQGQSWKPLLEGSASSIRDGFLYEYFFSYTDITDYEIQTANPPITPTIVAYRTSDAKVITYPDQGWVEFFDLKNDPYERVNLADKEQYNHFLNEMLQQLEVEKSKLGFKYPDNYRPAPEDPEMEDWRKGQ
jgi:arylsulfatase A-like enzyme